MRFALRNLAISICLSLAIAYRIRMELLLAKRKVEPLSVEEIPELETIGELDRFFTHINLTQCLLLKMVIASLSRQITVSLQIFIFRFCSVKASISLFQVFKKNF